MDSHSSWPGRYRLLDYIYTAFHQANIDGTPVLHPLWFKYPKDANTFGIDLQFFYGDSILVAPVTQENTTSVTFYLPNDIFYDFKTLKPTQGHGSNVTLDNVDLTQIPVYIKGGAILPLRMQSAMTTDELRKQDFEIIVAPDVSGEAYGQLYYDDGESIEPASSTLVKFWFKDRMMTMAGDFGYPLGVNLARVRVLGVDRAPGVVYLDGEEVKFLYDSGTMVLEVPVGRVFDRDFELCFGD